jgi:hypothetical protein
MTAETLFPPPSAPAHFTALHYTTVYTKRGAFIHAHAFLQHVRSFARQKNNSCCAQFTTSLGS